MNLRNKEQALFSKWQQNRPGFVFDGLVCEEDYSNSLLKIAIILKEVNSDESGWDLRKYLYEKGRRATWGNVTRWVYGIRNLDRDIPWSELDPLCNHDSIVTILRSICAINLKKSGGSHTANHSSLKSVAYEDRDYIKEQFAIYSPDLTICGGTVTAGLFKDVSGHSKFKWKHTTRGIGYYEWAPKKYVISYSHPEARIQESLLVYGLIDAVKELYA